MYKDGKNDSMIMILIERLKKAYKQIEELEKQIADMRGKADENI